MVRSSVRPDVPVPAGAPVPPGAMSKARMADGRDRADWTLAATGRSAE